MAALLNVEDKEELEREEVSAAMHAERYSVTSLCLHHRHDGTNFPSSLFIYLQDQKDSLCGRPANEKFSTDVACFKD